MTIFFNNSYLEDNVVIAGPFLKDGPLEGCFDDTYDDFYDGEKTFEDCEIKEATKCVNYLINNNKERKIDLLLSADLLNQIIVSNFVAKNVGIPYMGLYNACASFSEELILASSLLSNKDVKSIACLTSAHNLTSERQYRNPVEYGAPKKDYSTFTVSAATCGLITSKKNNIKITSGTIGRVVDLGVKDCNDMGSAMTPAAVRTLIDHLNDTKRSVDYYDLIITGDLGKYGKEIFKQYCLKEYDLNLNNYEDSAVLVYDMNDKRVLAGGSGPSCLPSYFYKVIVPKMKEKKLRKVLLLSTGAIFSTTTVNQKKSIPCICHAVSVELV